MLAQKGHINFAVGPVQSSEAVRAIGAEQVPYFRTPAFSELMLENERLMLRFTNAPAGSRAVFITGSGTASMEATVMNTLSAEDKALVINGGSFGHRFEQMLSIHGIPHDEIKLEMGHDLTDEILAQYEDKPYTALLVNVHETSTGVHYDIDRISDFCRRKGMFLIVDAISSFLADEFDMAALDAGVMITGSQKALACPPGISVIVLSPAALERVEKNDPKCMYFDLKDALKNGERGQTPFTPAVATLIQIHARLKQIEADGLAQEQAKIASLAAYFRKRITDYPFTVVSESLSNAVTPLSPVNESVSAYRIFEVLKDEYDIIVCPNGGDLKDKVFRVGHIGCLTEADYDTLFDALDDLIARGILR